MSSPGARSAGGFGLLAKGLTELYQAIINKASRISLPVQGDGASSSLTRASTMNATDAHEGVARERGVRERVSRQGQDNRHPARRETGRKRFTAKLRNPKPSSSFRRRTTGWRQSGASPSSSPGARPRQGDLPGDRSSDRRHADLSRAVHTIDLLTSERGPGTAEAGNSYGSRSNAKDGFELGRASRALSWHACVQGGGCCGLLRPRRRHPPPDRAA